MNNINSQNSNNVYLVKIHFVIIKDLKQLSLFVLFTK